MGQYVWYSGDLLTGEVYAQLPLEATSWSTVMDDSGALEGTVPLRDPDIAALNVPSVAAEGKCFLAVAYQDDLGFQTLLQAGPIWGHQYDDSGGALTIQAAGLLSYWDHRKIAATSIGDAATNTASAGGLAFNGWALGTIAKKILTTIGARTNGLPPIVFQADEAETADDDHSRTYNGWDMVWAGSALRDLTQVLNGPEIRFRPTFQTDTRFLQWVMDAGTEAQPLLSTLTGDWVFDATAPNSPVQAINVTTDATGLADLVWAKGNGSEAAAIIGVSAGSTLTSLGYPLLENEITGHDDVESTTTIYKYARAGRLTSAKRLITVSLRVDRDAELTPAAYLVGDYVQLILDTSHPYLPSGTFRSRIVQISGDDSSFVSLQLAPVFI